MFRLLSAAPRPMELTGAVDLVNYYGIGEYYDFFCKNPIPSSIAERHSLDHIVGDIDIRKGLDMELGQFFKSSTVLDSRRLDMGPYDLETLHGSLPLQSSGYVCLSESDKGISTSKKKQKDEKKRKRKHGKHKHKGNVINAVDRARHVTAKHLNKRRRQ